MTTIVYDIQFAVRDIHALYMDHLGNRPLFEWFLFFFPFFVFGEVPRYMVPAVFLWVKKLRGGSHEKNAVEIERFLGSRPSISLLLVGYNEEQYIARAIRSLLEFDYPNLEIVVVDDGSTDNMYAEAKPFADKGLIKLYRNSAATGRQGRPAASNMAFKLADGDFLVSVDSDTSFDHDALMQIISPFHDPKVGVVAGNLKPREPEKNLVTRMQALEYLQSITLWKTWLNLLGSNMQASGAFGAFRREAMESIEGWDPELAEDADISLKIKRAGWKVVFAPYAIAMTEVPDTLGDLIWQRYRWDRGVLRSYFRKHRGLMKFWQHDWRNAMEMSLEFVFYILLTFFYVGWFAFMLVFFPVILVFALVIMYFVYVGAGLLTMGAAIAWSERARDEMGLLWYVPLYPFYKSFFRIVRLYALSLELVRVNYEQTYLPESVWRNSRRW